MGIVAEDMARLRTASILVVAAIVSLVVAHKIDVDEPAACERGRKRECFDAKRALTLRRLLAQTLQASAVAMFVAAMVCVFGVASPMSMLFVGALVATVAFGRSVIADALQGALYLSQERLAIGETVHVCSPNGDWFPALDRGGMRITRLEPTFVEGVTPDGSTVSVDYGNMSAVLRAPAAEKPVLKSVQPQAAVYDGRVGGDKQRVSIEGGVPAPAREGATSASTHASAIDDSSEPRKLEFFW